MAITEMHPEASIDTGSVLESLGIGGRPLIEAVRLVRMLPHEALQEISHGSAGRVHLLEDPHSKRSIWFIVESRQKL